MQSLTIVPGPILAPQDACSCCNVHAATHKILLRRIFNGSEWRLIVVLQVYVLAIVAAMQRGAEMKETDLTILVPPYDPAEIFFPSYGHDEPEFVEKEAATPVASLRCAPRCSRIVQTPL